MNRPTLPTAGLALAVFGFLLAGLLSGCDASQTKNSAPSKAELPHTKPFDVSDAALRRSAAYRAAARELYEALTKESCPPRPALRRAVVLAAERAATRAFEDQQRGTAAAKHLAIARADVAHEQATDGGCWADDDPRFAAIHVRMARESVATSLAALRAVSDLPGLTGLDDAASSPLAAEFRATAYGAVANVEPLCRISARTDNDQILASARAELDRFKAGLAGTPWLTQFRIAEADYYEWQSNVVVECADPDTASPDVLAQRRLSRTREQIAALNAISAKTRKTTPDDTSASAKVERRGSVSRL